MSPQDAPSGSAPTHGCKSISRFPGTAAVRARMAGVSLSSVSSRWLCAFMSERDPCIFAFTVPAASAGGGDCANGVDARLLASCRTVGLSKMSVLGSVTLSPTTTCSWLRSSSAPSESMPASMSGASASTSWPAVRCTISSTTPMGRIAHGVAASIAFVAIACTRGTSAESSEGTLPAPSVTSHRTSQNVMLAGRCGCIAACSATIPCHASISPRPIAFIRTLMAPPEAIPTSAHGPQSTLAA